MSKNKYKSKFESNVAASFRKHKVKFAYETRKFPFVQPAKERTYTPDFELPETGLFVECKGKLTKEERDKLLWVRETYPELPFVLLFMRARNYIRKGSKTKYSDWCNEHKFNWLDWDTGDGNCEKWMRDAVLGVKK